MKDNIKIWAFAILALVACNKDVLNEIPRGSLSTDVVLSTRSGFEDFITALHVSARKELSSGDNWNNHMAMQLGTDVATTGEPVLTVWQDYQVTLRPEYDAVKFYWNWAYRDMLLRANTIIVYANQADPSIWESEEDKNAVIGEARFFRAYTYNVLANLYGDVPLVDTVYSGAKTDFTRTDRKDVLQFAKADLEFASEWLPETVLASAEGRIVKGAADHLLTEVYISLGEYDKAVARASMVINSGLYELMSNRFGSEADSPGDVFSDLFRDNNQNRSSGNRESIYVLQIEDQTTGGKGGTGNNWLRGWGPKYFNIKDPSGQAGMVVADSMGRSVGWIRPTNYALYDLWKNNWDTDIRNSTFNIRRSFTYNNPNSAYLGQIIDPLTNANADTITDLYPTIRKIEGKVGKSTDNTIGYTFKDFTIYRLSETYLLRAEAYLLGGDLGSAAKDVNMVRSRANASPATSNEMSLDYILDERARELIVEEPRRRTLTRMNKLVERVRKYNMRASTRNSIQDFHQWFPIPQEAIDANISAPLGQNPGY